MIKHIRRGHIGTRLAPKYKGRYAKLKENNLGVFHGSAISALLFVIYLDDVMEDMGALNRRTNLPMGIIQDRPNRQKEALIWGEIREEEEQKEYEEEKETYAIRNYTQDNMIETKAGIKKTAGTKTKNKQLDAAHSHNRRKEKRKRNGEGHEP